MRRNSLLLAPLLFGLAACATVPMVKMPIEVPSVPPVRWDSIRTVVFSGFFLEKEAPGFNLDRALVDYFREAMKTGFKGALIEVPIAWAGADSLADKAFWKGKGGAGEGLLILTGKTSLVQETRKALVGGDRRAIDEGPFGPRNPWSEKRAFVFTLDLALLDSASGEALFRKNYMETLVSENLRQSAEFALSDILGRIGPRIIRSFFGAGRPQERFLLTR